MYVYIILDVYNYTRMFLVLYGYNAWVVCVNGTRSVYYTRVLYA